MAAETHREVLLKTQQHLQDELNKQIAIMQSMRLNQLSVGMTPEYAPVPQAKTEQGSDDTLSG